MLNSWSTQREKRDTVRLLGFRGSVPLQVVQVAVDKFASSETESVTSALDTAPFTCRRCKDQRERCGRNASMMSRANVRSPCSHR